MNAAALSYIPDEFIAQSGLSPEIFIQRWLANAPLLTGIAETFLGRIAFIMLPILASELYAKKALLNTMLAQSRELVQRIGGDMISLTGLIPSALNYGQDIAPQTPQITTGHAVTVSAVVLMVQKILAESGRSLQQENVGILGLGSIGLTSLRLMLHYLPHPQTLLLCDIYKKENALQVLRQEIIDKYGFQGDIRLLYSDREVPQEFYDATLMIGATNAPDILQVDKLQPGTVLIDDSGPHCLNANLAFERFNQRQDILMTEGGKLQLPQPTELLFFMPNALSPANASRH